MASHPCSDKRPAGAGLARSPVSGPVVDSGWHYGAGVRARAASLPDARAVPGGSCDGGAVPAATPQTCAQRQPSASAQVCFFLARCVRAVSGGLEIIWVLVVSGLEPFEQFGFGIPHGHDAWTFR